MSSYIPQVISVLQGTPYHYSNDMSIYFSYIIPPVTSSTNTKTNPLVPTSLIGEISGHLKLHMVHWDGKKFSKKEQISTSQNRIC